MTTLFVLDIDDFRALAEVAATAPGTTVGRRGPYLTVTSSTGLTVDRRATGMRNALWYSSVAAVRAGRITQWDKSALRIEPSGTSVDGIASGTATG